MQENSLNIKDKQYIDLNEVQFIEILDKILQINNYRQSLKKWILNFKKINGNIKKSIQIADKNLDQQEKAQLDSNFQKYFSTIKPIIHNFSQCKILLKFQVLQNLNQKQYGFYSQNLTSNEILKLQQIFEPLKKFEILSGESHSKQSRLHKLTSDNVNKPYFQVVGQCESIYKMDLSLLPQNKQYSFWGHTIPIKNFIIKGKITKGKGIGKQVLGMPTANIQIPSQLNEQLEQYPIGIYATTVRIPNFPNLFIGASSLGTNPHYENTKSDRILEVYILHDFGNEDLYGKQIVVEFFELIRLQFKFKNFSAFLNGMRNDIQVVREWGKCFNLGNKSNL